MAMPMQVQGAEQSTLSPQINIQTGMFQNTFQGHIGLFTKHSASLKKSKNHFGENPVIDKAAVAWVGKGEIETPEIISDSAIKQKIDDLLKWAYTLEGSHDTQWKEALDLTQHEYEICSLHLANHHADIDTITLWIKRRPEYIKIKGRILFIPPKGGAKELVDSIIESLSGNEVEIIMPPDVVPKPKPRDYWDRDRDWKDTANHRVAYNAVYDAVTHQIEAIFSNGFFPQHNIMLADIGGGDGEFIEFLDRFIKGESNKRQMNYLLVDNSSKSIERAQKRLADMPNITIRKDNILSLSAIMQDTAVAPHIITALGVINTHVVDKEQALSIAQQAYEWLEKGGYFIVSGKTFSLVKAIEFAEMGFEIVNMSIPQNIKDRDRHECAQLYVLHKKDNSTFSIRGWERPVEKNKSGPIVFNDKALKIAMDEIKLGRKSDKDPVFSMQAFIIGQAI